MISVIIPTFNRRKYLGTAVDSVLSQTCLDREILIVDDDSSDGTKDLALSYGNKVRYIHQDNKERGAARNTGILQAKGDFIALLDSDDFWLPQHLQVCLETAARLPAAGLIYSGSFLADEKGALISKMPLGKDSGDRLGKMLGSYSARGCNASSCLIRKEVFARSGYFNELRELSGSEDWEMWVRIAASYSFASTGKHTAVIRSHNAQSSANSFKMSKSMSLSLELVFNNPDLTKRIQGFRSRAYSSMYAVSAVNYYAAGDMAVCRRFLLRAVKSSPWGIFSNRLILFTFFRSLLGSRLSGLLRKMKYGTSKISQKCLNR